MSKPVIIVKTTAITHEQWLTARRKGVGGSDSAAVCGLSRYSSPLEVWLQKTGRKPATPDNEAMQWGRLLEPIVREEFARRTGLNVKECPYLMAHAEYPFMLANVDGIVTEKDGTKSVLEIKTTGSFTTAKDIEDGLPVEWYCQVQHYMAVCDLPKAYVAVLINGNKMQWQAVDRDEETIRTIIALESHFWKEYVLKDVPPPVDEHSGDALAMLYPKSEEKSVILPAEADELVAQWLELKKAEDELKIAKSACENNLKALLKDAESGIAPNGYCVSWKSYSQNRLDGAKLKAAHPNIAEQFTTTVTGRKFGVNPPSKGKAKK